MNNNRAVFWALLKRDLYVMRKSIIGDMIDALILTTLSLISFGKLLPLIGMKTELIAPIYLGSSLIFTIGTRGYAFAMSIIYKITYEGLGIIAYQLTLPIDRKWLFAEYILFFVIETCVLTLPLLTIGTYILTTMIPLHIANIPLFLLFYLLTLVFWGTFFIGSAFAYDFAWFKANLWTRRIDWFIVLSSVFFPWNAVHAFSPITSYVMLFNPVTYAVEGMRNALFGTPTSLPIWSCLAALMVGIILASIWLRTNIHKTLDPI